MRRSALRYTTSAVLFSAVISSAFGQACPGDPGVGLALSPTSPQIGDATQLTLTATPGDTILLLIGSPSAPLATPIGPICVALPAITASFVVPSASTVLPFVLPWDTNLVGASFALQFIAVDASQLAVRRSNSIAFTISNVSGPEYHSSFVDLVVLDVAAAVADVTQDGIADIIVPHRSQAQVTVHRGDGAGNFTPYSTATTAIEPQRTLAVDFDGDGDSDLLTVGGPVSTVGGLTSSRNDGSGNFSTVGITSLFSNPTQVVAGDFDLDGDLDAATGQASSKTLAIVMGDGHGGFTATTSIPEATTPNALDLGDLDGDGDLDLVWVGGMGFTPHYGSTAASFVKASPIFNSGNAADAEIADLDGNGRPDVVIAAQGTSGLWIARNLGGISFQSLPVAAGTYSQVEVADLDADSTLDLVTTRTNDKSLQAFEGLGSFGFSPPVGSATAAAPNFLELAKLDGDEHFDALTRSSENEAIHQPFRVQLAAADDPQSFGSIERISVPGKATNSAVGDIDADGDQDIAVFTQFPSSIVALLRAPDGSFSPQAPVPALAATASAFQLADVNGDGFLDAAGQGPTTGQGVFIHLANGTGSFLPTASTWQTDAPTSSLEFVDVDNDGDLDMTGTRGPIGSPTQVFVYIAANNGTGSFQSPATFPTLGVDTRVRSGDFDLDGNADFIATNLQSTSLLLHRGDGMGGLLPSQSFGLGTSGPGLTDLADLENDGDLDVITFHYATRSLRALKNDGAGSFSTTIDSPLAYPLNFELFNPIELLCEDIDGDGLADSLITTKEKFGALAFYGNGLGAFGGQTGFGSMPTLNTQLAHLDSDGRIDVLFTSGDIGILHHR